MSARTGSRVALLFVVAAGCSLMSPPLSTEEVLKQDPAFQELLTQRTAIRETVQKLDRGLQADRHAILDEIQQRRTALRAKEEMVETQRRALEQRLDPARALLQAKLRDAEQQLRRLDTALKSLRRTRTELARLLQQAGGGRASADARQWQDQLAAITRQIPPLETQLASLRRQRTLYQAELRLLAQ